MSQSQKSNSANQRNAAEPYTIHLNKGDKFLDYQSLNQHFDSRDKKYSRWWTLKLEFISFEDSTLQLLNISDKKESHQLTIKIEPDSLHVSCDCGKQVYQLCYHAYGALYDIILHQGKEYFEKFRSNGLMELASKKKEYFIMQEGRYGTDARPKPGLGEIFLPGYTLEKQLPILSGNTPAEFFKVIAAAEDKITGYCVFFSSHGWLLPFLLPFHGRLTRDSSYIKQYESFIRKSGTAADEKFDLFLSEDQKKLNVICARMDEVTDALPATSSEEQDTIAEAGKTEDSSPEDGSAEKITPGDLLEKLFRLWEKAVPLLSHQQYTHIHWLPGKKYLTERPEKRQLETSSFS